MSDWLPWLVGVAVAVALPAWAWTRLRHGPDRPRSQRPHRPPGPRPGRTSGRPPTRPPRARTPGQKTARPQPGEIWWADVPYEDGTGSKVRPCLILHPSRGGAAVLKITSQDKSHRSDHIRIPTKSWDPRATHDSYLDLTDPIRVPASAFEDRAGTCDPQLWRSVQQVHHLPSTS